MPLERTIFHPCVIKEYVTISWEVYKKGIFSSNRFYRLPTAGQQEVGFFLGQSCRIAVLTVVHIKNGSADAGVA